MIEFVDDDAGYAEWIATHTDGFVVNTDRVPTRSYLVLHRASCPRISGRPTHGDNWTSVYKKICGTRPDLVAWAEQTVGRRPPECRTCWPYPPQDETWSLAPGDRIRRKELHDRYGGRRQGGIGPSATTPNVLIFTDPTVGQTHGYLDRWEGDIFRYVGEGQRGNQTMDQGNRAILEHVDHDRAIRLFEGSSGDVTYVGEFG